jgi:hypothetical protein
VPKKLNHLETRITKLEAEPGPASATPADEAAGYDWYGGACTCGSPPGECPAHARARASQRPPDGDWRTWLLLAGRGFGKMLDLETPIPTPSGWSTLGALAVGDAVFDEAGRVCRVTFVSIPEVPQRAYRLVFSDGSTIDACAEHQWVTWSFAERKALRRSRFDDRTCYPRDWPSWRLRSHKGNQGLPRPVVEDALRLHAAGWSCRRIVQWLGVDFKSVARHVRAGRFLEPPARVYPNALGPRVRTTEELARTLWCSQDRANHAIPTCGPLLLPDAPLPINPYVLGVWLGAGDQADAWLSTGGEDAELCALLRAEGCEVREEETWREALVGRYRMVGAGRTVDPATGRIALGGSLQVQLRRAGLRYSRHIPPAYLRAATAQRLALLQGLLDTRGRRQNPDGVWFETNHQLLAEGVAELVVSLGMKVVRSQRPAEWYGVPCARVYRCAFTPTMAVFRLARKTAWLRGGTGTGSGYRLRRSERMVVAAQRIRPRPMGCIAVDSPHRMYLCSRAMIPTHNTRTGAEWVRHLAETGQARRIALVAPTAADVRDVVVEGQSGILAVCPPWSRPQYEPSKRRLTWPSGAIARMYSADEPNRLRGPQFDAAYCDELACWRRPDAWSNLRFGLRLGANPRICVTTTPRPVRLVKDLIAEPTTVLVKGSTHENRPNLAPAFLGQILATYEGTRLGQQEIYAEILEIGEGAWFAGFDVAKYVSAEAEYDWRFPVHLGIDAGTSLTTAAVWFQVRPFSADRYRVTVFGEYLAKGLYSQANAVAIKRKCDELPCRGRVDAVRIDPAATARTGIGPAAYGEYERVFGRTLERAPSHLVTDGLDQIEVLLDRGDLLIHPRCVALKAAFQNYSRAQRGGEWLDRPADDQSPHEDLIDACRYGIRSRFPEGRAEQPMLRRRHVSDILY